jgi:hypothetical protein
MAKKDSSARGFFKNNPFFSVKEPEEPESQPTAAPQGYVPNYGGTPPTSSFPMPPPIQMPEVGAEVEQQYLDHFMQFLESKNFAGLDYLEFANTLHKMYEKTGAALTEQALYEMAFVSFEAQGVTKEKLVETAKQYTSLITEHKTEFDKYLANEGAKLIQDKTAENARLNKQISDAGMQIAQLEQQIINIKNSTAVASQTVQANTALIQGEAQKNQNKQRKFESAYKTVIAKITGDIEKINSFLK